MEKNNFVKNGLSRLPPGFRFHPTDKELVVQYLKRKVQSNPLPASIITEVDVGKIDPWDLPDDSKQERYFFTTRETKYPNGNRSNRATGSGYWKATGLDKEIVTSHHHRVVGMKKTLVFYSGKPPNGLRTDWIMHEYRLSSSDAASENWVLCRIFPKKRAANKNVDEESDHSKTTAKAGLVFYDFMAEERAGLNRVQEVSCSDSSGITEISISYKNVTSDNHEESSSCNSPAVLL